MLEDNKDLNMAVVSQEGDESVIFSDYYHSLDDVSKLRYREKVGVCGFDPYNLKKSDYSEDFALLPKVEYPDIVNYLVIKASWATNKEMKAYKSTEAYNFFVSGWVNSLYMKKVGDNRVVVYARVSKICTSYFVFCIYYFSRFRQSSFGLLVFKFLRLTILKEHGKHP